MQPKPAIVLVILASAGCGGGRSCPLPAEEAHPAWADANADGRIDVNDGVRVARHVLAGGPTPACRGQGDLLGRGEVSFEAAGHIWDWLFLGNATAWPTWDDCATRLPAATPPSCGDVELLPVAPKSVAGPAGEVATFDATVSLRASVGADAWSFGVKATGCTVVAATFDGTAAARTTASPPGVVAQGYAHVALVNGGVVTAVVPSWLEAVTVESGDVLALTVEATPPASGCGECVLALTSDRRGQGQAVAAVVGAGGFSYEPKAGTVTVDVCAE